ncbi:MAG: DNA polymerase IV [Gemmataceae bacterium]
MASPALVLHLDVDAFFAALEQRDQPALRGRPVAVGSGVVASCSYEARPWGVRTGMRLYEARQRCPGLIVVPGDYRRYELASRQILGLCQACTARVEMAALDDLYLDLGSIPWDKAVSLSVELAQQVAADLKVRVSLGLATNKLLAVVATQEVKDRKASGQLGSPGYFDLGQVPPGQEAAYLAHCPVEVLPGVGAVTRQQMQGINLRRVADLAAAPVGVLLGLFGKRALVWRQYAQGIDPRPVVVSREAQSVSRCTSFDPPMAEWEVLNAMLDHLVDRAALWLRLHGLSARGLLVRLRYADYQGEDSRVALAEAEDEETALKAVARERLRRLYVRRLPLHLIGIELSPLTSSPRQAELFPDPQRERQRRLAACKDAIRQRFGFMSVLPGTALELIGRLEHDRDNFRLRTPCLTR